MQSNILLSPLPQTVEVDGAEYEINSDFRTAIRFALLMQDQSVDVLEKVELSLRMFYKNYVPADPMDAINAISRFYSRKEDGDTEEQEEKEERPEPRVFDFEIDADYIYAAFLEQYGIDLTKEDFHWWKFKALFAGLSENTEFMKIIGYRTAKITKDMSKEQKNRLLRLKKIYALPDNRTEEEKESDFADSLSRL